MTNVHIRKALLSDQAFLGEMLYWSLYVPEGHEPFTKEVVRRPELAKYVENWGKAGDIAFITTAAKKGLSVGAAWLRLLQAANRGYG